MRTSMKPWAMVFLVGGWLLLWPACGDDDGGSGDQEDATVTPDAFVQQDAAPANATVSGTAERTLATCPPIHGGIGTLCLSLRTTCDDANSEVAGAEVPNGNMSFPGNQVNFQIQNVPDGTFQLYGFLDDDESGCDGALTTGDFSLAAGCIQVTVTNQQDVTGVSLVFDVKN